MYTFQCYIKGGDGYMDVPMRDGRAVINSAVLVDDSPESSDSPLKYKEYFIQVSDALDEAKKKEREGNLLRLYYADKGGFAPDGDTKIKLGLEHAAAVGEISLAGASQLTAKYGKFGNKITVDENAHLQIDDGEYSGTIDLLGGSASVSGGTVNQINLSNTAQLNVSGDMVYRNGKDSFTSEKPLAFVFFDGSTIVAEQIEQPCVLIAASYSGGRLIDVKIKNIKNNAEIALDEMNLSIQNADRVRAALWNSRESMTPLCKMAQMSLN